MSQLFRGYRHWGFFWGVPQSSAHCTNATDYSPNLDQKMGTDNQKQAHGLSKSSGPESQDGWEGCHGNVSQELRISHRIPCKPRERSGKQANSVCRHLTYYFCESSKEPWEKGVVSFVIRQNRLNLRELYKQAQAITDRRQAQNRVSPGRSAPQRRGSVGVGDPGQGSASAPPKRLASCKRRPGVS